MNHRKKKGNKYLKGLFFRIIIACLLFLVIYLGKKFTLSIYEYDAQKVIETIQNNELIDQVKDAIMSKIG